MAWPQASSGALQHLKAQLWAASFAWRFVSASAVWSMAAKGWQGQDSAHTPMESLSDESIAIIAMQLHM